MSLTSFLDNVDARQKFRQEFRKPRFRTKTEPLAPPLTNHYGLVGTAFDYLLRFYVRYLNPKKALDRKWVAEMALEIIKAKNYEPLYKKACNILSKAEENHSAFLETGRINDELIKSTLLLAQLDLVFRTGIVDQNIGVIDNKDVEDLRNLISLVDPKTFEVNEICLLNPTFGTASALVGGADADLVVDDVIIEIKTERKLELRRRSFNQLIGYYVLYRIGGIDGMPPKRQIKSLGIYFSRYSYFYAVNVQDIIDKKTFPRFLDWFKERAGQQYGLPI